MKSENSEFQPKRNQNEPAMKGTQIDIQCTCIDSTSTIYQIRCASLHSSIAMVMCASTADRPNERMNVPTCVLYVIHLKENPFLDRFASNRFQYKTARIFWCGNIHGKIKRQNNSRRIAVLPANCTIVWTN